MRVEVLSPFGVRITGIDLREADDEAATTIRALLADHGVLAAPAQHLDGHALTDLLRTLGPLTTTAGEPPAPDHPLLNVVTNMGRRTPPRSEFHVDTSYVSQPPAHTALTAVTVPRRGGDTLFSDQRRALATLTAAQRRRIEGRRLTHVVTGVDVPPGAETATDHPLVRPHPRSARPSLYLTNPDRCSAVSGLDPEAARRLIAELHAHSVRPENVLAHHWAAGDLLMWDNACVMHKADHAHVVGDRTLLRGMTSHLAH